MIGGIPAYARREIRRLLLDVIVLDGDQDDAPSLADMARRAKAILDGPLSEGQRKAARRRSRSPRASGEPRASKKETKAARRREVYDAVDARADGRCEFLFLSFSGDEERCQHSASERDHFWGRGREESVESVWKLCGDCHFDKTRNEPDRIYWLDCFRKWARNHGYDEQVAKCDATIALELAQHPEHRRFP